LKRHISLYYGSIDFKSGINLFCSIIFSLLIPRKLLQRRLNNTLSYHFKSSVGYYSLSSARGGIGALLKSLNQSGPDSEVIISAFTCLAVPTGIISAGFKPVYVDCSVDDINNTVDAIISKITAKTKVIIVQHTMGLAVDVGLLKERIRGTRILIFEDCALSLGTKIDDVILGSCGDATIISMELSKFISTGWGGIIVINNKILDNEFSLFYNGISAQSRYSSFKCALQTLLSSISYHYVIYNFIGKYILYFGYKWKLFRFSTNNHELKGIVSKNFIEKLGHIQLSFANFQFKRYDKYSFVTNYNYKTIKLELERQGYFVFNSSMENWCPVSPRIPLMVNNPMKASDFFASCGIEIGMWFDGPLTPTPDSKIFRYEKYQYPNANFISSHIINFPCHSGILKKDLDMIIASIVDFKFQNPESISLDR
jgi:perosamine synthetase